MNASRNIVFSRRPDGVSGEEFNHWYHAYIPEILAVPGFVSARRYRIEPVICGTEATAPWDDIPFFEIDDKPAAAIEEQKKLGLNPKESCVKLENEDRNGPALPEWWDDVRFASWNCVALGDRVESEG